MPRSDKKATPTGPCPNPECTVTETKSAGVMTEATKGMPRINITKQGCSRCLQPATTKNKLPKFEWTPETIAEAVDYARANLDRHAHLG